MSASPRGLRLSRNCTQCWAQVLEDTGENGNRNGWQESMEIYVATNPRGLRLGSKLHTALGAGLEDTSKKQN